MSEEKESEREKARYVYLSIFLYAGINLQMQLTQDRYEVVLETTLFGWRLYMHTCIMYAYNVIMTL